MLRLLAEHPDIADDDLDRAAAGFELAVAPPSDAALPDDLRARLEDDARRFFASPAPEPAPVVPLAPRRRGAAPWLAGAGWLAAAAALLLLIARPDPPLELPAPKAEVLRSALLAEAGDVVQVAWTATDDPAAAGAGGDVVWSTARQEGYLRFRGLAVNDPTREQYQLWIFDTEQDERHPIDGGVFDVAPGGETVVAIDAKLRVVEPTLFAITVEKPGGVVVSSRERLPLLAKVGG